MLDHHSYRKKCHHTNDSQSQYERPRRQCRQIARSNPKRFNGKSDTKQRRYELFEK